MSEKSVSETMKKQLFMQRKHASSILKDEAVKKADDFAVGYMDFMTKAKTERLAVKSMVSMAEQAGFVQFDPKCKYAAGDRVYVNNRGKAAMFAVIGSEPIEKGVLIAAAHIDSPRLDLKPAPLYEDGELAMLKTHYYGGIKKYQWTALPLSLHGCIIRRDGSALEVSIGEDPADPCFVITDLLPHLAEEQMKRTVREAVRGEDLNILVGSRPFKDDSGSELVKLNILKLLFDKYNIVEEDFLSAELQAVPAFGARDIGFDRSLIGAYGHDDRVCAYPAFMAALSAKCPKTTVITVLADKEEVGSDGNTGMNSAFFENFIKELAAIQQTAARTVLHNSKCLSADVNAGFDPTYPEVLERRNAAFLNYGVVITKYTGSRGKSDTSDASAEYMGIIRKMLNDANVIWQHGQLGKVDTGGGGTVAKYIARLDVDTVDLGVPVLSMHSPFEIVSKLDLYMAYLAFESFFKL